MLKLLDDMNQWLIDKRQLYEAIIARQTSKVAHCLETSMQTNMFDSRHSVSVLRCLYIIRLACGSSSIYEVSAMLQIHSLMRKDASYGIK